MFSPGFTNFIALSYGLWIVISKLEATPECINAEKDVEYYTTPVEQRTLRCDPKYAECCETGCCTIDFTWVIWIPLLVGIVTLVIFLTVFYVCWRRYREHIMTAFNNRRYHGYSGAVFAPPPAEMRVQGVSQAPVGFTMLPPGQNFVVISSGVPQEHNGSQVPITPPPVYNVAVPSAPLNPSTK